MNGLEFVIGCVFIIIAVSIVIDWLNFALRGRENGFRIVKVGYSNSLQYLAGVIVRFLCYPLFVLFGSMALFIYFPFFGLSIPNADVIQIAFTVVVPISVGGLAWAAGWGRYID
jgi:hypothetical protein